MSGRADVNVNGFKFLIPTILAWANHRLTYFWLDNPILVEARTDRSAEKHSPATTDANVTLHLKKNTSKSSRKPIIYPLHAKWADLAFVNTLPVDAG